MEGTPRPEPTNGRNHIGVSKGEWRLGITSKDMIYLVFVLGFLGVLFLSVQTNRENISRLFLQQQEGQREIAEVKALLSLSMSNLKEVLQGNNGVIKEMLQEQNDRSDMQLQTFITKLDDQTEIIGQMLLTHEFNEGRSQSERLPLSLPPSITKKRMEQDH